MASAPYGDSAATPPEPPERDWPAQAADTIVEVVDQVRVKSTEKVVVAARALVFGVVIGALVLVTAVLLVIGLVRAAQVGLSSAVDLAGGNLSHARAVWISYVSVGVLLLLGGGILWKKANNRAIGPPIEEQT